MSAADLVAAIRLHGLSESLVALYLSLRDDSRGPERDLERARRLCAAARQRPAQPHERVGIPAGHNRPTHAALTASPASALVSGGV